MLKKVLENTKTYPKGYNILKRLALIRTKAPSNVIGGVLAKKVQDFLDTLPVNWENESETYMSALRTLETGKAHCLEGAFVAALVFWMHDKIPYIMDLKSSNGDDHIVALYKVNGMWGAVSKTNHPTLRFRDPVYKNPRELALSYFHEYIHLKTGEKILVSYSDPIDLRKIIKPRTKLRTKNNLEWIDDEKDLFWLADMIDGWKHNPIYPKKNKAYLRRADHMELKAGNMIEWKKTDKGV